MLLALLYVTLGVVCILTGAVLVAPWRVDLYVEKPAESAQVSVRTHLRWTLFSWRLGGRGSSTADRPRKETDGPKKRTSSRTRVASARALLTTPGLVARTWRLVLDLGRRAWPRRVAIHARVGFDDPAQTGMFFGTCQGLLYAVPHPGWITEIEPDFDRTVLEGRAHVRWSLRVVEVLWPMLTFLASPVVWRGMRAVLRARRAGRV